jgi:co-chaperonin GroES (HSP10)
MTLQPFNDYLLVRIEPQKERTGLIFLPEGSRVFTGEVLAAGPGHWRKGRRQPLDVAVGERIAFFRENFEHLQGRALADILARFGNADHGLLRESDVLFALAPGFDGTLS